jgi:hypothetical protein
VTPVRATAPRASLALSDDLRMAGLARHGALWQPLCAARWGAACRPELYGNDWHALYAARSALPPQLLTRFDGCARSFMCRL